MKVTLIDCTGMGSTNAGEYAAAVLIFTKSTRLQMQPSLLQEIMAWPPQKKRAELQYMVNTIPSSWEFVDYTFMIEGVTRAFTHQLVRTRTASFAQQTMRVLDVKGWQYSAGPTVLDDDNRQRVYDGTMAYISEQYDSLIRMGAKIEDARGVLPTNILTNIVMKINMRNFVSMVRKRTSPRTQGEYRDVLIEMTAEATRHHPWLKMFVEQTKAKAAKDLDAAISKLPIGSSEKTDLIKLVDQLRSDE